jgi:hypothetical protein
VLSCFSFFLFFRSTTLLFNHTGLKTKLVGEHSIYPPFAEQVSDVHDCAACDAPIDIHHFFSMSCYLGRAIVGVGAWEKIGTSARGRRKKF